MKLRYLFFLLAIAVSVGVDARGFYWGGDFSTIFDNREGDSKYTAAKTFFLTQLAPEIGITFEDSTHLVAVGAVWTQPIGTQWREASLDTTIYYRYRHGSVTGALGMFPRALLHQPLPDYIWNDSCYYVQHNIRGAMIQLTSDKGFFEAVLDWRGMQSERRREAFNIIAMGERSFSRGRLLAGGTAMMNHFAKSAHPVNENVVDNFLVNLHVGTDLSKGPLGGLDSCAVRLGPLASLTRDRGDMKWKSAIGIRADIAIAWRWLEIKDTFYAGGKLFPLYSRYGAMLDQGEPFYAAKIYNRFTAAAYLLRRAHIDLRASLDFNNASSSFIFYQRLILRLHF